jgi:hypothetical protein
MIITRVSRNIIEYMTDRLVPGLSDEDFERSIANVGNRQRLARFASKLIQSSSPSISKIKNVSEESDGPVTVVVCGGSISVGHGVHPVESRYSNFLEEWLNAAYPVYDSTPNQEVAKHRVYNSAYHGADVSSLFRYFLCVRDMNAFRTYLSSAHHLIL